MRPIKTHHKRTVCLVVHVGLTLILAKAPQRLFLHGCTSSGSAAQASFVCKWYVNEIQNWIIFSLANVPVELAPCTIALFMSKRSQLQATSRLAETEKSIDTALHNTQPFTSFNTFGACFAHCAFGAVFIPRGLICTLRILHRKTSCTSFATGKAKSHGAPIDISYSGDAIIIVLLNHTKFSPWSSLFIAMAASEFLMINCVWNLNGKMSLSVHEMSWNFFPDNPFSSYLKTIQVGGTDHQYYDVKALGGEKFSESHSCKGF